MIPVPDSIDEVTADWLTTVLQGAGVIGCRVSEVESTHFGEGIGMMSYMVRCRLRYDAPQGGEPGSVIVKLEPTGEVYRKSIEKLARFRARNSILPRRRTSCAFSCPNIPPWGL